MITLMSPSITVPSKLHGNQVIRTPPHAPLKMLRTALKLSLSDVCARVRAEVPELAVSKGTMSAIESGSRGVSELMLIALARAYGLPDDALVVDYEPKARKKPSPAATSEGENPRKETK